MEVHVDITQQRTSSSDEGENMTHAKDTNKVYQLNKSCKIENQNNS